jgi:hypothetical protein
VLYKSDLNKKKKKTEERRKEMNEIKQERKTRSTNFAVNKERKAERFKK